MKRATSLIAAAACAVLVAGATQAGAAVVGSAPTWPIPSNAPASPPSIPTMPAAGDATPPADAIADPITTGASCGGWHLQGNYGDRWPASSTWWEYRCTTEVTHVYSHCTGAGACDTGWYGYPYDYSTAEDWTDYFLWNGSDAVFYGEAHAYTIDDGVGYYAASLDWWDGAAAQWYDLGPVLTVSKQGAGAGRVSSSPAGIDCGSVCQTGFGAATVVSLTATPDANSVFTGWSGDCSGTDACQVTMDQARAVSATFEPKRFGLTVSTAGTGSGLVYMSPGATGCRSCTQSFDVGTSVTLTPSPDAGSTFTGWSGDCAGTGSCQVTMDGARSVTATFALNSFTLTVAKQGTGAGEVGSTPVGISCGGICQASFDAGTAVTLNATPATGSIFTGWSGDCSGTASCQVTMDRAHAVSATFAANAPPQVSFTVTCTGLSCNFDGSGTIDADDAIVEYDWTFGDGSGGSGQSVRHDYARAGSYTVTLTATDAGGSVASRSRTINPISLDARGYKRSGQQRVDLAWNGVTGTSFDVYRNGTKLGTVSATAYTDTVGKGAGSYRYAVCTAGSNATCSNEATVTF